MAGITNPLSSLGGFQNQQLTRFTQPQQTAAISGVQSPADNGPTMPDMGGFGEISNQASRQHSMFLAALKAQQARQRPQIAAGSPRGGGGYSGAGMGGRYKLVGGADQALQAMNAAFRNQFGYDLKVNSGGRTRAEQQAAYDRYLRGGNLAAKPGHSVHESGRAVDFGGAIQNSGSREHRWLQQNASRWGFKWTGKNFRQVEPWHWEWWG